jgi:hypothetical protein
VNAKTFTAIVQAAVLQNLMEAQVAEINKNSM